MTLSIASTDKGSAPLFCSSIQKITTPAAVPCTTEHLQQIVKDVITVYCHPNTDNLALSLFIMEQYRLRHRCNLRHPITAVSELSSLSARGINDGTNNVALWRFCFCGSFRPVLIRSAKSALTISALMLMPTPVTFAVTAVYRLLYRLMHYLSEVAAQGIPSLINVSAKPGLRCRIWKSYILAEMINMKCIVARYCGAVCFERGTYSIRKACAKL